MNRFSGLLTAIAVFSSGAHALFDASIETGYLSGKTTTSLISGSSSEQNFSGYLVKPSLHLNFGFGPVKIGAGPSLTFPFVKYDALAGTVIKDELKIIRYAGQVYVRVDLFDFLQPFVRGEIGKDNISQSTSSYPVRRRHSGKSHPAL